MTRIIYSDHQKWKDQRHRELSILEKVVYDFIWDNASESGFYKIADAPIDAVFINCTTEQYRQTIASLCKPKSIAGGTMHRGFVLVENIVWISHYIKHNQRKSEFGKSMNSAHSPILKDLVSFYDRFSNEPEYMEMIEGVSDECYEKFNVKKPHKFPEMPSQRDRFQNNIKNQPSSGKSEAFDVGTLVDEFKKITNRKAHPNAIIQRNLADLYREGYRFNDYVKVIKYINKEWGQDEKMKSHITLETILGDKFPKYLNQAENDTSQSNQTYVPAHKRK